MFVCIWASDSGAYFVGSKLGKHLLWPQISPKKSIEGAIGGVVISMIAALGFALVCPESAWAWQGIGAWIRHCCCWTSWRFNTVGL